MSEERKIFNKKFVHFMWDDELEGKNGFFATDIATLEVAVEDNNPSTFGDSIYGALSRGAKKLPFHSDLKNKDWLFFYYDPLYEVKWAWKHGKSIQARPIKSTVPWLEWYDDDWMPDCYEYRIKPEKTWRAFKDVDELKKVWADKAGLSADYEEPLIWIRSKSNPSCTRLINGYNDVDVAIGNNWITVVELFREWEFLDGTPCGVEE